MTDDSILNAITDASDALNQFDDDETLITVDVPIIALRWLVHAASMHWAHTNTEQAGDVFYRIGDSTNQVFIDGMIGRGTLVQVPMLECVDCGVRSPDPQHFNQNVCAACRQGHAEWYKEHR